MLSKDSGDARRHFLAALLLPILTGLGLTIEAEDVIVVADICPEEDAAVTVLFWGRDSACRDICDASSSSLETAVLVFGFLFDLWGSQTIFLMPVLVLMLVLVAVEDDEEEFADGLTAA
jgi:uncharacterized membrane protein